MSTFTLKVDILSDWHIGNGDEAGAYADALALKDEYGLPYLPGKSLKGLIREAVRTGVDNNWFSFNSKLEELLFGTGGTKGIKDQGLLQFSSASLSETEKQFFQSDKTSLKHLTRVIHSTAVNHESGVAEKGSLRAVEYAIPMQLQAEIVVNEHHPSKDQISNNEIENVLSQVFPLINNLGAKRQRGFGLVQISLSEGV